MGFDIKAQRWQNPSDLEDVSILLVEGVRLWLLLCPTLRLALFEKLHREHPTLVQVVTVSADDPLALKRVMAQGDYTMPCLLDSTGEVTARYAVERLPRTLVIDSSGEVLSDQTGQLDQASLKALLTGLR